MLLLRLLFDFGLVVLIWLVQMVIYPGFQFYTAANLKEWHITYTFKIGFIVVPLMMGQLILAAYQLWQKPDWYTIGSIIIIISIWILTFSIFVPLHNAIAKEPGNSKLILELVKKNWLRTFLWTALFLWNVSHLLGSKYIAAS